MVLGTLQHSSLFLFQQSSQHSGRIVKTKRSQYQASKSSPRNNVG